MLFFSKVSIHSPGSEILDNRHCQRSVAIQKIIKLTERTGSPRDFQLLAMKVASFCKTNTSRATRPLAPRNDVYIKFSGGEILYFPSLKKIIWVDIHLKIRENFCR
jgi:hypothetical protein